MLTHKDLGGSGLKVGPLVFGGNVFNWTADEATSLNLLDAFIDSGLNMVDSADVYSSWVPGHKGGESEDLIGKWLARGGQRDKLLIATKCGMEMGPEAKGLSRGHITRSVDASLKRLGTDYIDLYQAHMDDRKTPLEETLSTYTDLIKEGKIRAIGASNYSAERLAEALQVSKDKGLVRYESLQPQYNLYDRADYESSLEKTCVDNGLGVIPYFALAAGFLTGKYRSKADLEGSQRGGMVKGKLDDRGMNILDALDQVAGDLGATPTQVALAWLIARPSVSAPIVSATSLEQWADIEKSMQLDLSGNAMNTLEKASA
ncbi:MAG: aldo/keto reductase [Porticoccaceae bacterium]|nr:aldo/keto reductase [Porticoccaceae bacterium]